MDNRGLRSTWPILTSGLNAWKAKGRGYYSGWFNKRWLALLLALLTLTASATLNTSLMREQMQGRYGEDGVALLDAWQRMLSDAQPLAAAQQVAQVNQFFNQHIRYSEDLPLWQQSDYWATPVETLGLRAGDCEDYSIAKYLSLLALGIPPAQLRLIYVRAQIGGPQSKLFQAHMVLGYYPDTDATPLILDSLVHSLLPANERPDLRPVFSFNSQGLWIGGQLTQADPTARLSRWRDLLTRVEAEGFSLAAPAVATAEINSSLPAPDTPATSSATSSANTPTTSNTQNTSEKGTTYVAD